MTISSTAIVTDLASLPPTISKEILVDSPPPPIILNSSNNKVSNAKKVSIKLSGNKRVLSQASGVAINPSSKRLKLNSNNSSISSSTKPSSPLEEGELIEENKGL